MQNHKVRIETWVTMQKKKKTKSKDTEPNLFDRYIFSFLGSQLTGRFFPESNGLLRRLRIIEKIMDGICKIVKIWGKRIRRTGRYMVKQFFCTCRMLRLSGEKVWLVLRIRSLYMRFFVDFKLSFENQQKKPHNPQNKNQFQWVAISHVFLTKFNYFAWTTL